MIVWSEAPSRPNFGRVNADAQVMISCSFHQLFATFASATAASPTVTAHRMNTLSIRAFIPPLTRRGLPLRAIRCYAVQAPGAPTMEIFSNQHKWMQKERAAANVEASRSVDYLRDEVASRLCERVLVCLLYPAAHPHTDARRTSTATLPTFLTSVPMHATLRTHSHCHLQRSLRRAPGTSASARSPPPNLLPLSSIETPICHSTTRSRLSERFYPRLSCCRIRRTLSMLSSAA